jgi:hypothetical protein
VKPGHCHPIVLHDTAQGSSLSKTPNEGNEKRKQGKWAMIWQKCIKTWATIHNAAIASFLRQLLVYSCRATFIYRHYQILSESWITSPTGRLLCQCGPDWRQKKYDTPHHSLNPDDSTVLSEPAVARVSSANCSRSSSGCLLVICGVRCDMESDGRLHLHDHFHDFQPGQQRQNQLAIAWWRRG